MIYFDAHVHIHDRFSLQDFLTSSLENFSRQQEKTDVMGELASYILMLTESKDADVFTRLYQETDKNSGLLPATWTIELTEERESLLLRHRDWPERRLFIFAGRQVVTQEKLEVLALATAGKFLDGLPIQETIDAVHKQYGIAALPWGAGKWLGGRGKIISTIIEKAQAGSLFVGDNGGRPKFWPAPQQFIEAAKRNIALLPGSDPLPLSGEDNRIATYGARLGGDISSTSPVADFKALLTDKNTRIEPFGKRMDALRFFKTQLLLRLK